MDFLPFSLAAAEDENNSSLKGDFSIYSPTPISQTKRIITYVGFVINLLGICGSILAIAVFSRKVFASSAASVCLRCLAISDIANILAHDAICIRQSINSFLLPISTMCVEVYFFLTCMASSRWFLIVITLERATAVLLPHKVKYIWTRRRCWTLLMGIALFFSASNAVFFFIFEPVHPNNGHPYCKYIDNDYYPFGAMVWYEMVKMSLLPCLIIVTGNVLIAFKLWSRRIRMSRFKSADKRYAVPASKSSGLRTHSTETTGAPQEIGTLRESPSPSEFHSQAVPAKDDVEKAAISIISRTAKEDNCIKLTGYNVLPNSLPSHNDVIVRSKIKNVDSKSSSLPLSCPIPDHEVGVGPKPNLNGFNRTRHNKKEVTLTLLLIMISTFFILTNGPLVAHTLMLTCEGRLHQILPSNNQKDLQYYFNLLSTVNVSCNFLCYCITGSQFRHELQLMVLSWYTIIKRKKV